VHVLINSLLGQAKFAIWLTRKHLLNDAGSTDVVSVLKGLLKSRIQIEFTYYKLVNLYLWCWWVFAALHLSLYVCMYVCMYVCISIFYFILFFCKKKVSRLVWIIGKRDKFHIGLLCIYWIIKEDLKSQNSLYLSLSLSLSLSLFSLSLSLSLNSIQFKIAVNYTILPKLSIYVQKYTIIIIK